jgi:hypothetical protein
MEGADIPPILYREELIGFDPEDSHWSGTTLIKTGPSANPDRLSASYEVDESNHSGGIQNYKSAGRISNAR